MFRAMIPPFFRSTRLCVYSLWYNAPIAMPAGNIVVALYHKLIGIINKPLLLHPVGVYIIYINDEG